MVKKRVRKKRTKKSVKRVVRSSKRKINLAFKNLVLFVVLSFITFLLYNFLSNDLLVNLFLLLAIIFGFVAVAFLIVLLVFLVLRIMKK
jgi:polyferredoxin